MKLDEMQEALSNADHPLAEPFERALCAIGDAMAQALAAQFDIICGSTSQEGIGFAGICCPFNPRYRKQALPEAMECFDDVEAWDSDDKELPKKPRKRASRASAEEAAALTMALDAWADRFAEEDDRTDSYDDDDRAAHNARLDLGRAAVARLSGRETNAGL